MSDEPRSVILPEEQIVATEKDKTIPSQLYDLDGMILSMRDELQRAMEYRETLLKRATALSILSDDRAQIVKRERNLPRTVNVEKLAEAYPNEYATAVQVEKEAILTKAKELYEKASQQIPTIRVKTLQALLGERMVDEVCFPHEISVSYDVVSSTAAAVVSSKKTTSKKK